MGLDKNGNYVAVLPAPALPGAPAIGIVTYGTGAPSFIPYPWQIFYVDEIGGVAYVNQNNVWVALSSGGGGVPQVISGAGQPVSNPGVTNAVYTDTTTSNQFFWYGGAWH